ncbi:hypothetical protein RRG08_011872 [Elysia crispata]|uniref:Uncharacterized protein n=1 Tax=Elysia crispata TaxID=231223 RepID=A0AAE1DIH0_9GAST|nr:hypothetical protein RRG08_011872 [Elysia crispata]
MSGWLLSGLGGMLTSRTLDQSGGGMDVERSRREGREKLDSDGMEGAERRRDEYRPERARANVSGDVVSGTRYLKARNRLGLELKTACRGRL